jgi:hypothetical protein
VDSSKLGVGEIVAGASGLALFVFMFLPWYGIDSIGGFGVGGDANAWEAFSFIDILLFLVAVVVVGMVLVQMAESTPDLPSPPAQIIMVAGVVALVLILFRLLFTPGIDTAGLDIDVDLGRKIGIFLGLIAAAGITYGGWRAMNEPVAAGTGGVAPGASPSPPAPSAPAQETPAPPVTPDPVPPTPAPEPIPTPDPVPPTPIPDPTPTPTPDPAPPAPSADEPPLGGDEPRQ